MQYFKSVSTFLTISLLLGYDILFLFHFIFDEEKYSCHSQIIYSADMEHRQHRRRRPRRRCDPSETSTSTNASLLHLAMMTNVDPIVRKLMMRLIDPPPDDDDDVDGSSSSNTDDDARRRRRAMERLFDVRNLLVDLREVLSGIVSRDVTISVDDDDVAPSSSRDGLTTTMTIGVEGGGISRDSYGDIDDDSSSTMTTGRDAMILIRRMALIASVLCDVLRWDVGMNTSTTSATTNATAAPPPHRHRRRPPSSYDIVHRGAIYACMEHASTCLESLWGVVTSSHLFRTSSCSRSMSHSGRMIEGCDEYHDHDYDGCSPANDMTVDVVRTFVLPSLISCAVGMANLECIPSGGDIDGARDDDRDCDGDGDHDRDCDGYDERGDYHNDDGGHRAMDTGVNSAMAMLSCVRSFFAPPTVRMIDDDVARNMRDDDVDVDDGGKIPSTRRRRWRRFDGREKFATNDEDSDEDDGRKMTSSLMRLVSREVGSAMGGALVARLVEGCLSLLSSSRPRSNARRGGGGHNDDTVLHLEALMTLGTLMDGIPSTDLWRSMLPGCFAGLYRYALSGLRHSSHGSSSSYNDATAESVRALAELLELTLSVDDNPRRDATSTANDAVASLMSAVAGHRRLPSLESKSSSIDDDDPPPMDPMRELKSEVNDRLIGPISVLLSMLPSAAAANGRHRRSGIELRESGLRLCRAIMTRDVRSFWTESNRRTLERKSLEYCFMTLGDDDEVEDPVSMRRASEIVSAYKSYYFDGIGTIASRWRAHLSAIIVPAILELMDALPAFAKSGREMHVRHHLRLIDGYLMLSFRGNDIDSYFNLRKIKGRRSDIGSALSCAGAVDTVKESFSGERQRMLSWQ